MTAGGACEILPAELSFRVRILVKFLSRSPLREADAIVAKALGEAVGLMAGDEVDLAAMGAGEGGNDCGERWLKYSLAD